MKREKKPWLDYTGQTTPEILACKDSHRIDSLLCAFESAIMHKQQTEPLSQEEMVILAIEALEREVNNGGYRQFFDNSSREYVPMIVDALERVGSPVAAGLTAQAIAANGRPDREQVLNSLDTEFYKLNDLTPALLHFIEVHQENIRLTKVSVDPPLRPRHSNVAKLCDQLLISRTAVRTLEEVREVARGLMASHSIPATERDVDAAAHLYLLGRFIVERDVDACQPLARAAFELAPEETWFSVRLAAWVTKLINASRLTQADQATLDYLVYLKGSSGEPVENLLKRVSFWAKQLREHSGALPRSAAFFKESYPEI
jgi:hypothetical protein